MFITIKNFGLLKSVMFSVPNKCTRQYGLTFDDTMIYEQRATVVRESLSYKLLDLM